MGIDHMYHNRKDHNEEPYQIRCELPFSEAGWLAMNDDGIRRRWTAIHKICHISVNANLAICLELGLVATVGLVHVSPALTAKESKYSN